MPKITIVRPYEWANQQRNTHIYIDGEKVGCVGIDQTVQFEVSPERHKIVLKQRWSGGSKALEVDLSDNKDITIKMKSFQYGWLIVLLFFIFGPSTFHTVTNTTGFWNYFLANVLVVGLLYLLLFILFFRTRYIKLKKVPAHADSIS